MNNSISRVIGLDPDLLKKLRMTVAHFDMSIWIRTKNRYRATTMIIDEHGQFPSGLVKKVSKFLFDHNKIFTVADNRIKPKYKLVGLKDRLNEPPLYPEQDIAAATMCANELGICEMPTGIGKSRTIKETLLRTQRPSLIITPSSNLRAQTYEYLSESFGTDDVGLLKFSHDKPIVVTNYHALSSKSPEYFKQFAQLIFDEFHNAAAEGVREDFATSLSEIYYRYGLTATNFRNAEGSNIYLESILSETLYSVSTIEAIKKGYIRPLVSFFYSLKNSSLVAKQVYKSDLKSFIDTNAERNDIALEVARKMYNKDIPTIMLVNHIEHGKFLKNMLGDAALFLNGQDESAAYNMQMVKRFNQREIPILIGTDVLGEGVDTKACGAIINLSGGKAKSELMQKCGRTVRNFPGKSVGYYFDFFDNGQKHLKAHSNARAKIIQEVYGQSVNILS